jgi:hypothetical protein
MSGKIGNAAAVRALVQLARARQPWIWYEGLNNLKGIIASDNYSGDISFMEDPLIRKRLAQIRDPGQGFPGPNWTSLPTFSMGTNWHILPEYKVGTNLVWLPAAEAEKAYRELPELLTPEVLAMDRDAYSVLLESFADTGDRAAATAAIVDYLPSADQSFTAGYLATDFVRRLNKWYGMNFGQFGSNFSVPWPKMDNAGRERLREEITAWQRQRKE